MPLTHQPTRRFFAALLLAACGVTKAAPDPAGNPANAPVPGNPSLATGSLTDPIMNLLGERGLLRPLGSSALVESVRNSVRDTAAWASQ